MFLIYMAIMNVLIGYVYKVILECQPTNIKLQIK